MALRLKKIVYFFKMLNKKIFNVDSECPSCGPSIYASFSDRAMRKFPTSIRYCTQCKLFFRCPHTNENEAKAYYEYEYNHPGLTTDLPDIKSLESYKTNNFKGTEKDFSEWFELLRVISTIIGRKIRVLDYGANWGYAAFQFNALECVEVAAAYEVSSKRADFGRSHMGIYYYSEDEFDNLFDVVISSHAIEHMHNPAIFKTHVDRLLNNDGFCIIACPNGSMSGYIADQKKWRYFWGEVHPNFISDTYLINLFKDYCGFVCDQEPNKREVLSLLKDMPRISVSLLPESSSLMGVFRRIN